MLRGDLEGEDLERYVEERVVTTTFEKMLNWARAELDLPAHLRPRLLRDRGADLDRHRPLRPRPLRRRGAARLAAPGRPDHPLGPGLDQDGAGRPPPLRPDAGAEVGDLDGRLLLLAAACSPTTPSSRAPTSSCRSTSTSPAARRGRRRSSTASPSCSARSMGNPDQGWRQRYNAAGTEEWARGGPAQRAERRGGRGLRGGAGADPCLTPPDWS